MKYSHLLSALDTVQFSSVDRDPEAIVQEVVWEHAVKAF